LLRELRRLRLPLFFGFRSGVRRRKEGTEKKGTEKNGD
jgi:hypothetical protein